MKWMRSLSNKNRHLKELFATKKYNFLELANFVSE